MSLFLAWQISGFISGMVSVAMLSIKMHRDYPTTGLIGIAIMAFEVVLGIFAGGFGAFVFGPLVAIIPALAWRNHGESRP